MKGANRSQEAHGDQLARYFRLTDPPTLNIDSGGGLQLAMTRLSSESGSHESTSEVVPNRAFTIPVHLSAQKAEGWKTWTDGKLLPIDQWEAGGVGIFDLGTNPVALRNSAFDCVHYFLPRATVDAFTDQIDAPRVETLSRKPGGRDHVLLHLAQLISPVLRPQDRPCDLYLDNYLTLFCSYVVGNFAIGRSCSERFKGGLAPWQKRVVEEMIREHLRGDIRLKVIAERCGISAGHLSRCFKRSFGTTLHQYLIEKRLEKAKVLLLKTGTPLLDIAYQAGFSDQAAFSRAFRSQVGTTPARWRKERIFSVGVAPRHLSSLAAQ